MDSVFFLKKPFRAFLYATAKRRGRLLAMYVCVVLGNGLGYTTPYFLNLIADKMVAMPAGSFSLGDFAWPLGLIVVFLIASEVSFRIGHLLETSIVLNAYDRITTHIYQSILSRPVAYFEKKFSGELGRRVEQIGESIKFFIEFFPWEMGWPIIGAVMTTALLVTVHPWLAIAFVIWLIQFLAVSYPLLRWQYRVSMHMSEKSAELSGAIVDVFSNMPIVSAFAAHKYEHNYNRRYLNQAIASDRRSRNVFVVNKVWQGWNVIVLSIALILIGVYLFTIEEITIGGFVVIAATVPTFTTIIWSVGETVIRGITSIGEFKNALVSLDTEVVLIKGGDRELALKTSDIAFGAVSFAYPSSKQKIFDSFSLTVRSGERIGLVGRSGAGKSTLVKLLMRSYDPDAGKVEIGGEDIASVTLESLRGAISFVPQDTALFHRSLFENILYAKPTATHEEVIAASKRAHAHEFIEQYPDKYETLVGERGVKLSGGQRQRIALARAMLKNSPILVLDEATSSLDSEGENVVQKGLQELFQDRTVLAIAHRLSTLRSMDRIVVIDDGHIVEDGSPQDLLTKEEGIFKAMWKLQKDGFV